MANNLQIRQVPKKRLSVNDALTNSIFSMGAEEFKTFKDCDECKFLEGKKKQGNIFSSYWLKMLEDSHVDISRPLEEFDRSILDACISAQNVGNEAITVRSIWKFITGNPDAKITDGLRAEILNRIDKLAVIRLKVDITDAVKAGFYNTDRTCTITSKILPCDIMTTEVNGQIVDDVIIFRGNSLILELANLRRGKKKQSAQILTYDNKLFNVPNQRNTLTTTAIKSYIVRRVKIAKAHDNISRTILFETLLKRCGLSDADKRKKQEIRKTTESVMRHLVTEDEIKSFNFAKTGNAITKINFQF